MPKFKFKPLIAFILLGLLIYNFRNAHGNAFEYVIATAAVILFWYLLGLRLALANLRNILILTFVFGLIIVVFRYSIPFKGHAASVGLLQEFDLDPAQVGLLNVSHEVAMEIHLKKAPGFEERYFKFADLAYAPDGLHYSNRPQGLNALLMPKTLEWVKSNLTGISVDDDTAQVKSWFIKSFTYSLAPGVLDSSTPLDQFLFERRQGFCEHFAAAFTTLMRLKGYQGRVAFGYAGGTWNPIFKTLTFENADAHAWVEIFDTRSNRYRIIDPTSWVFPSVSMDRSIEDGLCWKLLMGVIFILLCGVFFVRQASALDRFILKVSQFEKKHGLESKGLTLSERVPQITVVDRVFGEKISRSLKVYLEMYRVDRPSVTEIRALNKSLAAW